MLQSLLTIYKKDGNYYFDLSDFGEPLLYALIGFLVVFAGIVILIGIIWLMGFIMRKTNNLAFLTAKKNKNKKQAEPVKVQTEAAAPVEGDIPDEVKAAIVAALMAYYETREEKCEFTVKRIKRL